MDRHLISKLCTQAQLETQEFHTYAAALREPVGRMHRKLWEYCFVVEAVEAAGLLKPGASGLGFGVGREPLTAFFASRGCEVVATDLIETEARDAGWVDTGQHATYMEQINDRGICDPTCLKKLVQFRNINMKDIPSDLTGFDFLWSCCALEHLGSIQQGGAFILSAMRALKPGGVAIHTTEFNVSSNSSTITEGSTVLFRKRDIQKICSTLLASGHKISVDWRLGDLPADRIIDQPPYKSIPHMKLQIEGYTVTSIGLIIRKGDAKSSNVMRKAKYLLNKILGHKA